MNFNHMLMKQMQNRS